MSVLRVQPGDHDRAGTRGALAAALVLTVVALAGCAAGPNNVSNVDVAQVAGFWPGVWHGMIYPVTFVVSLFNKNVNLYEVHNNGGGTTRRTGRDAPAASRSFHVAHDTF